MTSTISALKTQFDLDTRLYNNVLDSINETESNTRNSEHTNHIKWIAGHLLNTRMDGFSRLTGGVADTSYQAQFGRGSALDVNASYPSIDELKSKWNTISEEISNRFLHMPEELLDSNAPGQSPVFAQDPSFRGLLAFLVSHECYHIGQLSILRKLSGKPAMSYN